MSPFPAGTEIDGAIPYAGQFFDKGAAVYNVMHPEFGATGNGTTDDTAAIQAAITEADSKSGGVVYFPPGTYSVTTNTIAIKSDIVYRGAGRGISIIKSKAGQADLNIFTAETVNDVVIEYLGFEAGGRVYDSDANRDKGNCIFLGPKGSGSGERVACKNVTIRHCSFTNAMNCILDDNGANIKVIDNDFLVAHNGESCVHMRGTADSWIDRNHMENTVANNGAVNAVWWYEGENKVFGASICNNMMLGFSKPTFETIDAWITSGSICGNYILGSDETNGSGATVDRRAIQVGSHYTNDTSNIDISGNVIKKIGVGIKVFTITTTGATDLAYTQVHDNLIEDCSQQGIFIQPASADEVDYFSVRGNTISDINDMGDTTTTFGYGIAVDAAKNLIIGENLIYNVTKGGIFCRVSVKDFQILGNHIDGTGNTSSKRTHGIHVQGGSRGIVSNNLVRSCGGSGITLSGTTVDINVNGNMCINNGAQTNTTDGIALTGSGIVAIGNQSFNTSSSTGNAYGLSVAAASVNVIAKDNILRQNRTGPVAIGAGTGGNTLKCFDNAGQTGVTAVSSAGTYDVLMTDLIIKANSTAGNITIALPAVNTRGSQPLLVVCEVAGGNTVSVNPNGSDKINGTIAGIALNANLEFVALTSDGAEWYITGQNS